MNLYDTYQFRVVSRFSLGPGDPRDPFRFYSDSSFHPLPFDFLNPELKLEVQDLDGNRQINEKDRFVYVQSGERRIPLKSEDALKLLNYYVDPDLLKSRHLGVVVTRTQEGELAPHAVLQTLESLPGIAASDIENIRERHFPYWELDGHVDLDVLAGVRIYTHAENDRWVGSEGILHYLDWRYFRNRVLIEKGAVAASFVSLEYLLSPAFVWQTYTTNYLSSVTGTSFNNSRLEGRIEAGFEHADGGNTTQETRRLINMQTAKSRSEIAKERLYFHVTWPVVLAACAADPAFRRFVYAPGRGHLFGNLYRYFGGQFSRALPFIGKNPFALGMAALSGYGIYELSTVWFDVYGHLPQGTTENRSFSLASTLLTQAALYARASREMELLTASSRLSLENVLQMRRLDLVLRPGVKMGRMNFFGLKVPFPKPGLSLTWIESLPSSRLLGSYGAAETGAAELGSANLLARRALIEKLAAGEVLGAERAGLTVMSRLAAPAATEELLLAENIVLRSRMKSVGLPLLAGAALLGAGIGFCYLTGIFNEEQNPRTLVKEYFGL